MSRSLEESFEHTDIENEDEDSHFVDTQEASNSQSLDSQHTPSEGDKREITEQEMNLMKELCRCLSPMQSPAVEDDVIVTTQHPKTMASILQDVYDFVEQRRGGQEEEGVQEQGLKSNEVLEQQDWSCQGLDQRLDMQEKSGGRELKRDGELCHEIGTLQQLEPAVDASETREDSCNEDIELSNVLMLENALKILESMRTSPAAQPLEPALDHELENVLVLENALKKVNGNLAELSAMGRELKRIEEGIGSEEDDEEEEEDLLTTDLERALESCPLIMDDDEFSRRFMSIEAWAAQQIEEEKNELREETTMPGAESFRQEEEVTKSAKNLFAKKTKTLFHWLHPEDSKADLRMRVERAWHKLSQKESEFYYSQVLGPFNHRQVKPMINPRIYELLNLPMSARPTPTPCPESVPPLLPYRKPAKPPKPPKAPKREPAPRKKRGPYNKTPKHLREGSEVKVKRHRGPNKKKRLHDEQGDGHLGIEEGNEDERKRRRKEKRIKEGKRSEDDYDEDSRKRKKFKRKQREEINKNERKRSKSRRRTKDGSEGSDDEDWYMARKRKKAKSSPKRRKRSKRRRPEESDEGSEVDDEDQNIMKRFARRFLREGREKRRRELEDSDDSDSATERKVIVERMRDDDDDEEDDDDDDDDDDDIDVFGAPQPEKEYEISAELTRDLAECDKMLDSDDSW